MDYPKLKNLILTMPGYTAGTTTNAEILTWLNTPSITKQGEVPKSKLLQWLAQNNRLGKLEAGSANANTSISNLCKVALKLLNAADVANFDTSDATNVAMLDQLVASGVFNDTTDSDKSDLMALGSSTISPAEDAGLGVVREGDVIEALSGRY